MKTKLAFKSEKGKSDILNVYDSLLEQGWRQNDRNN